MIHAAQGPLDGARGDAVSALEKQYTIFLKFIKINHIEF